MTKAEKSIHDQRLINQYNSQLTKIDHGLARADLSDFEMQVLLNHQRVTKTRLMRLYGTEKYHLAT